MKLDLNRVLDREGEVDVVTTDVDFHELRYCGYAPFKTPVKLTATAKNTAGVVTLNCSYVYTLDLQCDRCLAPVKLDFNKQTEYTVVRSMQGEYNDEYIVAEDGFVELDELATDDIVLSLPQKVLCKEDCKGLCPECGCNLNYSSCSCKKRQTDPRLAALDDLIIDEEEN